MNSLDNTLNKSIETDYDAVVIGAGFSGLYMLNRLREAGFSTIAYEAAEDVGGVWYWNRYPGARCDTESFIYNYFFSEELYQEWTWSSRYPGQKEILSYLNYVADKFNLRKDIQFNKRVKSAYYDSEFKIWKIYIDNQTYVTAKFFIPAVGLLSVPNVPNFKGLDNFSGEWYHTGNWPKEKVNFEGKRVGVIGTGSSGIQAIPIIAKEASHLTVFQRTPQYSIPARNYEYDPEHIKKIKLEYEKTKREIHNSPTGDFKKFINKSALDVSDEERLKEYEKAWKKGGFLPRYSDLFTDEKANETAARFLRSKISNIINDEDTAKKLMPKYYYGTKRQVLDTNYYDTYNRGNVTLIDVKNMPIEKITSSGVKTIEQEYELDLIVFATGYDAITGPLFNIDIKGIDGVSLQEKWENGSEIKTYLGIMTEGFPNMFMITGPETPSVLVTMPLVIETHVNWIINCIQYLDRLGMKSIEAEREAERKWHENCVDMANNTLYTKTDSWFTGANVSNKPKSFPIYLGGFPKYYNIINEIADEKYKGFVLN